MLDESILLTATLRSQITEAIRQARTEIRWKPGKAQFHLAKRIRLGHLANTATLADYELIIRLVLSDMDAVVYGFRYNNLLYPTVVAWYQGYLWLVMLGLDGIMETAFPPDEPISYFQNPKYQRLGLLEEFYDE